MTASTCRNRDGVWLPYGREGTAFGDLATRVHVWRIGLDGMSDQAGVALSEEERRRADRLSRPEDRRRFLASRIALRTILADILAAGHERQGRALRLGYGAAGKPFLVDAPGLHFNVSHSGDLAVIAASGAGEVGIDIEAHRPVTEMDGIARMLFNEAERAAMLACPEAAREALFYRTWTRKEALLKAIGTGLTSLTDPDAASFRHAGAPFVLSMLPHLDGFTAALARPRETAGVRLWSWPNRAGMRANERRARPRTLPTGPSGLSQCEAGW